MQGSVNRLEHRGEGSAQACRFVVRVCSSPVTVRGLHTQTAKRTHSARRHSRRTHRQRTHRNEHRQPQPTNTRKHSGRKTHRQRTPTYRDTAKGTHTHGHTDTGTANEHTSNDLTQPHTNRELTHAADAQPTRTVYEHTYTDTEKRTHAEALPTTAAECSLAVCVCVRFGEFAVWVSSSRCVCVRVHWLCVYVCVRCLCVFLPRCMRVFVSCLCDCVLVRCLTDSSTPHFSSSVPNDLIASV